MGWSYREQWAPYVPVAQKKNNAVAHAAKVAKKQGREPAPVKLDGRKITTTFWGKAWCENLEAYSDYSNRLPRGATYVRNGSVVDLVVKPRCIEALVAGSETYKIKIDIDALSKPTWKKIKQDCSASIDSLLDLLAGRFSDGVMQRLTQQKAGLFPSPSEIKMKCSCPDGAYCCKHLAAVMYGVGARLDKQPELLFVLRDVDHQELVSQAVAEGNLDKELGGVDGGLAGEDLGALFGIELDSAAPAPPPARGKSRAKREVAAKPPVKQTAAAKKKVVAKQTATKELAAKTSAAKTQSPAKLKAKTAKTDVAKARGKTAEPKRSARKIAG
ncbi:MAG: SWIM zinc finger family protein [Planctomycetaceae bacterium]